MSARRPWCSSCGAYLDEGHAPACATAEGWALLDDEAGTVSR